jgi:hypothetical protein
LIGRAHVRAEIGAREEDRGVVGRGKQAPLRDRAVRCVVWVFGPFLGVVDDVLANAVEVFVVADDVLPVVALLERAIGSVGNVRANVSLGATTESVTDSVAADRGTEH